MKNSDSPNTSYPVPDPSKKSVPDNHQTQTVRDPSGKLVSEIGKEEKENGTT